MLRWPDLWRSSAVKTEESESGAGADDSGTEDES